MKPSTIVKAALALLGNNVSVIPVRPVTKKPPEGYGWRKYQSTHLQPADVPKHFLGDFSLAAICGEVSENLETIDLDYKAILLEAYRKLVEHRRPGLFERLLIQKTQNDGRHIVYRTTFSPGTKAPGNMKLARMALKVDGKPGEEYVYNGDPLETPIRAELIRKAGGQVNKTLVAQEIDGQVYVLPCAIETRGEGGYFLVAPSRGYEVLQGSFDDIPTLSPEERQVLIDCAVELDEAGVLAAASDADTKSWRVREREGEILPGDRFNNLASLPNILLAMDWTPAGDLRKYRDGTILQYWTRPGKEEGVSGTYFPTSGLFHVFTTNAFPLEGGKTYDAFGLYVRHAHEGKFAVATAKLMAEGIPAEYSADDEITRIDCTPTVEDIEALQAKILADINAVEDPKGAGFTTLTNTIIKRIAKSILPKPAQGNLLRRIKTLTKCPLSELNAVLKDNLPGKEGSAEGLSQPEAMGLVLETLGREDLIYHAGLFYRWGVRPGVWVPAQKQTVESTAQDILLNLAPGSVTAAFVQAVTTLIRNNVSQDENPFNTRRDLINVKNGTLRYHEEFDYWEFSDSCREDFLTTQIPVAYDPDAKAPRFSQFLQESFQGEEDAEDKALCLTEFFGYALMPMTIFEKFMLLAGPAGSGKSVTAQVLQDLLGPGNYASVAPDQWGNKFQLAHLHNKLANIVEELPEGHVLTDDVLKKIVSGNSLTAEHKGMAPFDFDPFCSILIGTNHVPHTRDFSGGVFRRALFLGFNHIVPERKRDPHLRKKLQAEMPGILNMALAAYAGLLNRGGFTIPTSSRDLVTSWRKDTNYVEAFAEECLIEDLENRLPVGDAYEAFVGWVKSNGVKHFPSKKGFSVRLKEIGMTSDKSSKGQRVYRGLNLTQEAQRWVF
jgi:putative DNA primase/helicase